MGGRESDEHEGGRGDVESKEVNERILTFTISMMQKTTTEVPITPRPNTHPTGSEKSPTTQY